MKDEKLVNNTNKDKKRNKRKKILIIFGFLIIITLVFLVWFIFNRKPNFTGERIDFSIAGSRNVQSGGLVEYRVSYKNKEDVALKDIEISLIYPDGFSFESSSKKPADREGNKWNLKKISSKAEEEITISGKLYGNTDDQKECIAFFNYTPANINTSFKEESRLSTKILKTDLLISSNFPSIVLPENSLDYSIKIKNNESFELSSVKVKAEYPKDFEFTSASPEPSSENKIWNFSKMASGQEVEIKIKEKALGKIEERKSLNVEAGVFDRQGKYYKQKEQIFETKIAKIDANLEYFVSDAKDIVAKSGDLLEFKINYKNTGTENLPDAVIEGEIKTEFLEESSILVEGGKFENGKIKWDSSTLPSFKDLAKGKEGSLKFRAKIKENIGTEAKKDLEIKSKVKMTSLNSKTGINLEKESDEIKIKIGTIVKLESIGRYYDFENKKVGNGSIPPKVGQTTTYRVYLFASNSTSEVFDGRIEISLPVGVSFTGVKEVKQGSLAFLGDKLVWDIGRIKEDTGGAEPRLEANFEVGITPTEEQVGKAVSLISKTVFSGIDSYTKKTINLETKEITTELKDDPNIKENERVVVK